MVSRLLGLGVVLVGEAAAVVGLHALGALPWLGVPTSGVQTWLAVSPPADVAAALLRLVALGGAYWLLLSTVSYVLARVSRVPAAIRGVERVTLPVVRRLADRALAVTMATSSLFGAAAPVALAHTAAVSPPAAPAALEALSPALQPPDALPEVGAPAAREPDASAQPAPQAGPDSRASEETPAHEQRPAPPNSPDGVHVVEPGDHLWGVAAADLAAGTGRAAEQLSAGEIAPHWRDVVADNQDGLRSGDPDLIYPGEHIELPPRDE